MMKVATMVAGEQEALPSVTSVCRLAAPRPRQANNSQDQRETGYLHGARCRVYTWVPGVSIGSAGGKSRAGRAIPSKLFPPKLPPKLPLTTVKAPGVPLPHMLQARPTNLPIPGPVRRLCRRSIFCWTHAGLRGPVDLLDSSMRGSCATRTTVGGADGLTLDPHKLHMM